MKANSYWMSAFIAAAVGLSANPTGMETVAGKAEASVQGSVLQVLAKDRTIIQWDSFSIASGEMTKFILPDASAAVLNRVTGAQMSELMGVLQANGQIYLINPHGVIVGADARIDTANFIASTFDVLNEEFIAKADLLFQGDSNASIVNLGTIATESGNVILLARNVRNEGSIEAPNGTAVLAGGTQILLKPEGSQRVFIQAAEGNFSIDNAGRIAALAVEMQASGNPYAAAIRHDGQIEAIGVKKEHGRVLLVADEGRIDITGNIQATASESASAVEEFGEIRALAKEVYVTKNAVLNVSNASGGGLISLGFELEEDGARAIGLVSTEDTWLKADSLENGCGGKVLMWGTDVHYFAANVSAKGGAFSGDGGFVDASTLGLMEPLGLVDTSAPFGLCGTLLYDPTDITIGAADANVTTSYNAMTNTLTYNITNPLAVTTISAATLGTNLVLNNVSISTASSGPNNGDITVSNAVIWTPSPSPTTLNLFANRDINFNANVTGSGNGSMNFTATRDINVANGPFSATLSAGQTLTMLSNRNITIGSLLATAGAVNFGRTFNITTTNYYDGTSQITIQSNGTIGGQVSVGATLALNINAAGSFLINGQGFTNMIPGTAGIVSVGNVFINTGVPGASITLAPGDMTLQGNATGTAAGTAQILMLLGGDVTINIMNSSSGLRLLGSPIAGNGNAKIQGDNIYITANAPVLLNPQNTNTSILGAQIVANESLTMNVKGNCTLVGGAFAPSEITSTGPMTVNILGSLGLTANAFSASITSFNLASNALTLTVGGACSLISSAVTSANISSSGGMTANVLGNLIMTANAGAGSSAVSQISSLGTLNLTVGGSAFLTGSTAATGTTLAGYAQIISGISPLNLTCTGDLYLTGGSGGPSSSAIVGGYSNAGGGIITVSANNIFLNAGSSGTANGLALIGQGFPGSNANQTAPITVTAQNNILLKGGTGAAFSVAQIGNTAGAPNIPQLGGNITVTAGQSITMAGTVNTANYNAVIGHGFAGAAGVATYPNLDTVAITAGKDLIMCSAGSTGGKAIIANFSLRRAEAIRIICDNNNPTAPDYGASSFFFGENSLISAIPFLSQVSIFTSVRIFNTKNTTGGTNPYFGTINGTTIVTAAPLGVDSVNEVWGVYPTDSTPYNAQAFTIYYKRIGGIMVNGTATTAGVTVGPTTTFPVSTPELYIAPAQIVTALGTGNVGINAENLSGSTNNSILITGSTGNIAMPANTNTLTLSAAKDVNIVSSITSAGSTPTITIDAGKDCIIGNGTSNYNPSLASPQLTTQPSGFTPSGSSPVNVTTGRDHIFLDGIINGNSAQIIGASPFVLNVGRDLSLLGAGGFARINSASITASIGRNMLQKVGGGPGLSIAEVAPGTGSLTIGGQHTMIGGGGALGSYANLVSSGDLTHTVGTGLTLTGGTGGGNALNFGAAAFIQPATNYTLTITNGNLSMTGGVGGAATIQESGAGNVTINVPNGSVLMNGAAGSINPAIVAPTVGDFGTANIKYLPASSGTLTMNVGGNLLMTGGAGPGCLATISTLQATAGPMVLNITGNLIQTGGSGETNVTFTAGTSTLIRGNAASTMAFTIGGDWILQGGSGQNSYAFVASPNTSPVISLTATVGGNFLLSGGTGINSGIIIQSGGLLQSSGMTITVGNSVNQTGDIIMTAGSGWAGGAYLLVNAADLNVTAYGNIVMNASATGAQSVPIIGTYNCGATGVSVVNNTINVTAGHNIVLNSSGYNYCLIGNGGTPFGGTGALNQTVTGVITVNAGGDIILNGAASGTYSPYMLLAQQSLLSNPQANLGASGGFAMIGNLNLPAESSTVSGTFSGAISVTAGGSITLNGSSSASAFARIGHGGMAKVGYIGNVIPPTDTFSGSVFATATNGSISLVSPATAGTYTAVIRAFGNGNALSMLAGNNTYLTGGALLQSDSGAITMLTGVSHFFTGHPLLTNTGIGGISVVCDNLFPNPPGYGFGALTIDSTVFSTPGALRLYSVARSQNNITSSTFNGSSFIPGTLGVNSSTEQWGFWYPQTNLGVPYTFYYKYVNFVPPSPPSPPPSPSPSGFIVLFSNQIGYLIAANSTIGQFTVRGGAAGGAGGGEGASESSSDETASYEGLFSVRKTAVGPSSKTPVVEKISSETPVEGNSSWEEEYELFE